MVGAVGGLAGGCTGDSEESAEAVLAVDERVPEGAQSQRQAILGQRRAGAVVRGKSAGGETHRVSEKVARQFAGG